TGGTHHLMVAVAFPDSVCRESQYFQQAVPRRRSRGRGRLYPHIILRVILDAGRQRTKSGPLYPEYMQDSLLSKKAGRFHKKLRGKGQEERGHPCPPMMNGLLLKAVVIECSAQRNQATACTATAPLMVT